MVPLYISYIDRHIFSVGLATIAGIDPLSSRYPVVVLYVLFPTSPLPKEMVYKLRSGEVPKDDTPIYELYMTDIFLSVGLATIAGIRPLSSWYPEAVLEVFFSTSTLVRKNGVKIEVWRGSERWYHYI